MGGLGCLTQEALVEAPVVGVGHGGWSGGGGELTGFPHGFVEDCWV